jgi:hypothetical protein
MDRLLCFDARGYNRHRKKNMEECSNSEIRVLTPMVTHEKSKTMVSFD